MEKSPRACIPCSKNKRRCDRTLPSCGLCARLRKSCEFPGNSGEVHSLRQRVQQLEHEIASRSTASSSHSPSTLCGDDFHDYRVSNTSVLRFQHLFIDSDLQESVKLMHIPYRAYSLPSPVLSELGDAGQRASIANAYFKTVHEWMPIIGKQKWKRLLDPAFGSDLKADQSLLLLCMKLIQHIPEDVHDAMRCGLYMTAKQFATAVETAGFYSLTRVQSNILIAVYEMGHGIFPAAYMTLASCAAQAIALGLHDDKAPQILERPGNHAEWEERLRTFWMIRILDRYITAGGDRRPLFTEEARSDSHLPTDDDAWDHGHASSPDSMLLSSLDCISASPFARVAQASHLLGQVIQHCNKTPEDFGAVKSSIELLTSVTNSLLQLLTKDEQSTFHFRNAIALCLSALLKLYDNHSCDSYSRTLQGTASPRELSLRREVTEDSVRRGRETVEVLLGFRSILEPRDDAPWMLHCFYKSAANLAWYGSAVSPLEAQTLGSKKATCVDFLQSASKRWRVADAYLEALCVVEEGLKCGTY
ncbi:hypothetical protein B0I35DRAFT_420912 [Stachybotrys elegans]|uniref:Zn(2)-C6 fungal-type domain-containing protein n=1 Tax=Stachybotrys elegans TaxID=80388 RepID=A0A8K0T278_9HYPO|nr:hypothetical protein B0I35DRAFT_420912 [Stachybotrys elegans]